jgi:hypothetical protein
LIITQTGYRERSSPNRRAASSIRRENNTKVHKKKRPFFCGVRQLTGAAVPWLPSSQNCARRAACSCRRRTSRHCYRLLPMCAPNLRHMQRSPAYNPQHKHIAVSLSRHNAFHTGCCTCQRSSIAAPAASAVMKYSAAYVRANVRVVFYGVHFCIPPCIAQQAPSAKLFFVLSQCCNISNRCRPVNSHTRALPYRVGFMFFAIPGFCFQRVRADKNQRFCSSS